jgi:hypothetical protein
MTSVQVMTHGHGTPVVHCWVAGWTFQPAGYEMVTPDADVKLPVKGAKGEADGLALAAGPIDGKAEADGEAEGTPDGDAVATEPGPVPDERNGPATASPTPTTITAAAAIASLAKVFMRWNLRGARMSTRRCRVVSMEARASCRTRSGACRGASAS